MSLYGALFGGVSGLAAQSSKMGVISDNIANVNTVGYKQGTASFASMVVNSNGSVSYQTGGVRASTIQDVTQQGLLQSTESSTDLAISGGGFFVVKSTPDGGSTSTPLYTRAGSFTQDSLGNFVNANGYYLQGWPLDREGRLPGEPGNLDTTSSSNFDSLETVNVQSASGVAQATSTISLGANLKASEVVYPGQTGTFNLDSLNTNNLNQPADAILVGSEYGLAGTDDVQRGDTFTASTGGGLNYSYEYGGFTVGRDISSGNTSTNYGDLGNNNQAVLNLTDANIDYVTGGSTFEITLPNNGLKTGDTITLAGLTALGATPSSELNAPHVITRIDDDHFTITTATPHGQTAGTMPTESFTADTRQFQGNVLDATSATGNFLGQTGSTKFTAAALTFTISNATSGTVTFHYTNSAPNTLNGEFNNLDTLAQAINSVNGLTARVVNNRLVVGAENASEGITFANGDTAGTDTLHGINWTDELDVQNIQPDTRRFSSIQGLANLVNADAGVTATVDNPLSNPTLSIGVDNPLDTIAFGELGPSIPVTANPTAGVNIPNAVYTAGSSIPVTIDLGTTTDITTSSKISFSGFTPGTGGLPGGFPNGGPYSVAAVSGTQVTINVPVTQDLDFSTTPTDYAIPSGASVSIQGETNSGSLLGHLGLDATGVASLAGAAYTTAQSSGTLGPQYDPTGTIGENMASGDITAQFSRNVRIYDSLGTGHDIRFSFIKTATNTWAVEVHAIPATDISTSLPDGQIATGNIVFNGDGTLRSVSSGLTNPLNIAWVNGAVSSSIALDLGTAGQPFGTTGATVIGQSDGLSQFDSDYNVNFANQNGAPVGQLESVSINDQGLVIASYSNGETQSLYQLPLASFANPDGLRSITGDVYAQTRESGEVNLREAGTNGTGTVVSAALEQSNVDLASELTDMIVAQRAYQANTKVIKTADDMLDQLNQV